MKNIVKNHLRKLQIALVAVVVISTSAAVVGPRVLAGSPSTSTPDNGTQNQEQNLTEQNQSNLDKAQPVPQLQTSLERANLIKKLNFTNNANQIGYVYLLGQNGQVVANYTIKGKVSSLNSLLTTPQQIQCPGNNNSCLTTVSPDLDGSYGSNPDGIFFFTTSGAYVEWAGPYMYASQPLNITTPVTLVQTNP